jgi:tetratricopeptide (TPR) repeat protein
MALQGSKSSQNRYLLAHCCVQLSLFGEGEEALIATGQERDTSAFNQVPGGSCGIYLLGMIYKHQHRKEQAISCFKKCLKMDPTHWASAIELSGMGEQIDPGKLFGVPLLTAKEILEGCKIKEGDFRRSTTLPNGKKIPEQHIRSDTFANWRESSTEEGCAAETPQGFVQSLTNNSLDIDDGIHGRNGETAGTGADDGKESSFRYPGGNKSKSSCSGPGRNQSMVADTVMDSGAPSSAKYFEQSHLNDTFRTPSLSAIDGSATGLGSAPSSSQAEVAKKMSFGWGGASPESDSYMGTGEKSFAASARDIPSLRISAPFDSSIIASEREQGRIDMSDIALVDRKHHMNMDSSLSFANEDKDLEGSFSDTPFDVKRSTPDGKLGIIDRYLKGDAHPFKIQRLEGIDQGTDRSPVHNQTAINPQSDKPELNKGVKYDDTTRREVHSVLVVLYSALQLMSQFRCRECVLLLQLLPTQHFRSGLVQHMLGRVYFDANNYKSALVALSDMLHLEPYRTAGTEILSTVLWHLKKDKDLSCLAQRVTQVDRESAECWCVVGNSFSLQQEPEIAIRFFERATQVDPYFAYAYTLCGHEMAANEDLGRAITAFRQAIECDSRHYNAWYGLATIYSRFVQCCLSPVYPKQFFDAH